MKTQVPEIEDILEEEEDEEDENEGVDWMTDASPEVKRWGEMADEYNTKPSEIAFLQVSHLSFVLFALDCIYRHLNPSEIHVLPLEAVALIYYVCGSSRLHSSQRRIEWKHVRQSNTSLSLPNMTPILTSLIL